MMKNSSSSNNSVNSGRTAAPATTMPAGGGHALAGTNAMHSMSLTSMSNVSNTTSFAQSQMLFNANSLKDLLGGKKKITGDLKGRKGKLVESNAIKKRKKERQANNDLFKTILKEETGLVNPSTKKG
jgi:hypothetical protein